MSQFEDVGSHGTKVLIYNLWMDDDDLLELDFDDDDEVTFCFHGHKQLFMLYWL